MTLGAAPYLAGFIVLILLVRWTGPAWMPILVGAALAVGGWFIEPDPSRSMQETASFTLWCGLAGIIIGIVETVRVRLRQSKETREMYRTLVSLLGSSLVINLGAIGLWIFSSRWLRYDSRAMWVVWAALMGVGVVVYFVGAVWWCRVGSRKAGAVGRFMLGAPVALFACYLIWVYADRFLLKS